jgi:sterol 3beta-glucosyltransferase
MRILISTLGTRGDVQPYLALAQTLVQRGHEVQLAAPHQFAALAKRCRVPFATLPGEFLELLNSPEGKVAIAGGRGVGAGLKLLPRVMPLMGTLLEREWQIARSFSPDLIVCHPKSIASPHIAERLSVPHILASPLPGFTPTRAFPSPLLPFSTLGPLNRISHSLALGAAPFLFGKPLRTWRSASLGLPARAGARRPTATLYAYSPHVLPVPDDWGENILVSGYWFLDEGTDWVMPPALARFFAEGKRPVYVGFGSMPGIDPAGLSSVIIDALSRAGKRGVLAIGGGALSSIPANDHIHVIDSAPHDALFALVEAAVHHGGAGTTAASLRAGLPTIICPFFGDQPFWGRRVAALGAGPAPIPIGKLTVEGLVRSLKATDDPRMRGRALTLAAGIARDHGVDAAALFIEKIGASRRTS